MMISKKIKLIVITIIELRLSEGISKSVSRSVENSVNQLQVKCILHVHLCIGYCIQMRSSY